MPAKHRALYRGDYRRRAQAVREAAYADPETRCWRCGLTLFDHGFAARWDAGHLRDGDPTSPLAPEASSCNRSAGAALRNGQRERKSRSW